MRPPGHIGAWSRAQTRSVLGAEGVSVVVVLRDGSTIYGRVIEPLASGGRTFTIRPWGVVRRGVEIALGDVRTAAVTSGVRFHEQLEITREQSIRYREAQVTR